ncbi:MAG TPA: DUF4143 domain-containing protein, partial [Acidimicrobiales bacterium]
QVVPLDDPARAAVFRADPDAALRRVDEPVLLDEWQVVPEVLGAVKRAVDHDPQPGRFLLAGSVRAELEQQLWPATGRAVRLRMHGLTEREVRGHALSGPGFIDKLAAGDLDAFRVPAAMPDLPGYVELAVRGTFPQPALHLGSDEDRRLWFDSYLEQLLGRDAVSIQPRRDPVRLRRYFEALAASTAGTPADATIYDAVRVNAKTAAAYESLLESLHVYETVPAYSHNRLKRLARLRKRYLLDPALVSSALQVTVDGILEDVDLLGRVFDTFAAAQLRPEVALDRRPLQMFHVRDKNGRREVDLLIDLGRRGVVGLEFKATAAPGPRDAAHLAWLRDELGSRFLAGGVLHSGPGVYELGDRLHALPLCVLWS